MIPQKNLLLGVNIDHVAMIREQRHTCYPDPVEAARAAEAGGADGITIHLREDRRHIQDADVFNVKAAIKTRLNFEMAVTTDMIAFAKKIKPTYCCLVPERREELTTEGGLNVIKHFDVIRAACHELADAGIQVSLFIDPDLAQIDAAVRTGAPLIELHTGEYAETTGPLREQSLQRIQTAAKHAAAQRLTVNAGHGLYYDNVQPIAAIPELYELNIGHGIVARSVFVGFVQAVREMKTLITKL